MIATETVVVDLGVDHARPDCLEFSWKLHRQLSDGYTRAVSVMQIPEYVADWRDAHRTARKRADRAQRLGYRFDVIDRRAYEDDIFRINTSKTERQGRPMSPAYLSPHRFGEEVMVCPEHHVYPYGVLKGDRLAAYLWLYRCGELAMVSSILGHADDLTNDVMYLLLAGAISSQIELGGTLFYNLHASGTDGLRYFKERIGFEARDVEWRV